MPGYGRPSVFSVLQGSGPSDGLMHLRAYELGHPGALHPALIEDDCDVSLSFAEALIAGLPSASNLLGQPVVEAALGNRSNNEFHTACDEGGFMREIGGRNGGRGGLCGGKVGSEVLARTSDILKVGSYAEIVANCRKSISVADCICIFDKPPKSQHRVAVQVEGGRSRIDLEHAG